MSTLTINPTPLSFGRRHAVEAVSVRAINTKLRTNQGADRGP